MMRGGSSCAASPLVPTCGVSVVPAQLGSVFRLVLLGSIILLGSTLVILAETPASAFDAANKLYEQGNYKQAADAYKLLVQKAQVSAPLYFNLGNALFKAGQIGQA